MPLCTVYLLSLQPTTPNPIPTFISALQSHKISPLVVSRVIRWIILPTATSTEHLLARNIHWDLLLILPAPDSLPAPVVDLIQHQWTVTAGVPSRLLKDFPAKNKNLLYPDKTLLDTRTVDTADSNQIADSAQNLELSKELKAWIEAFYTSAGAPGKGAVSMLNLLSFKPGMKSSYLQYGKAFGESVGSRHGGNAKIVGTATAVNGTAMNEANENSAWDEIALAHYPSILHFRDMLASQDYQQVNHKFRVPALRDTFILMTSEIDVGGEGEFGGISKGKL